MMLKTTATPLLLLLASVLFSLCNALDVTLKPVRYCSDHRWWGCKTRSYPWGSFWKDEGVGGGDQDKIFMAYLATPPSPANVKNIVFMTSGQQGSSGGADESNVISGFQSGWSWNTREDGSKVRSLHDDSLAVRFKNNDNNNNFSTSDTVYITVANPMFNHMMWSSTKDKLLRAYKKFLGSHVSSWSNVENIYLAGSSRGGCLVARLAKELMDDPNIDVSNASFTVHIVDGVCKYTQSEYGTTSSTIDNPNSNRNFKAYKTNIGTQVSSNKDQMCMRHVVGGDEVTGLALGVRAFTHSSCHSSSGCTLYDSNGKEYYNQSWHDLEHIEMGRDYSHTAVTVENFLGHYENTCKVKFGA